VLAIVAVTRGQQKQPPDPARALTGQLTSITKQVMEMAGDFPAEKYEFKATPEVRSFREVIVHAMSGTQYAAKAGRGEKANWDEVDPKTYRTKTDIVTALQNSIADCAATLRIARELLALAATVKWSDGQPFRVGVALHYGVVTCGNVGLDAQRDATIIGDAVNTVFRLESLMKELDRQILFSADFREHLATGENFIDLGERKLKGKQQLVRVYGLV